MQYNFMKINEKIRRCREALDLSQMELAKRCGWKGQSRISGYERGEKQPPLKAIKKLEEVMGLPSGYLTTEDSNDMLEQHVSYFLHPNKTLASDKKIANYLPQVKIAPSLRKVLLLLQEAHRWNDKKFVDDLMQNPAREKVYISDVHNPDCFVFEILNDSMDPKVKNGDRVITDPHLKPKFGSFVVVKLLDSEENILAQYFEQDGSIKLRFINNHYPELTKSPDKVEILGIAIEINKREKLEY
jgi:transcriptional regulator with XRE-family HTH domain